MGAPSVTYPGVQDVLDFNANYGIWVSAPPGTSASPTINSYYGGSYITSLGSVEPIYQVTEGSDGLPSFNSSILVNTGNTGSPFSSASAYPVFSTGASTITMDKLHPTYINTTSQGTGLPSPSATPNLFLNFTRGDGTYASVGFVLSGGNLYAFQPATPGVYVGGNSTPIVLGTLSASSTTGYYKIVLTSNGTYTNGTYTDLNFLSSTAVPGLYPAGFNAYLTTLSSVPGSIQFQYVMNASGLINAAIYQTSPRQTAGVLTLSKIDTTPTVLSNGQTVTNPTYGTATFSYSELAYSTSTYNTSYPPMSTNVLSVDAYNSSNYMESLLNGDLFINTKVFQDIATTNTPIVALGTATGLTLTSSVVFAGSGATQTTTTTYTFSGTVTNGVSGSVNVTGNPYYFANGQTATQVATALGALGGQGANVFSWTSGGILTVVTSAINSTLVGVRGLLNSQWQDSSMLLPLLTNGYNYATQPPYQDVKVFFDPHRLSGVATIYATLRAGSSNPAFPFSTFISAIAVSDGIPGNQTALQTATNNIITTRATYPNVAGLAYYCNEFFMQESVNGTYYWGFPIGAVANMLALIMDNRLGGVAPMFTNEGSPSLGGQLSKAVKRAKFSFTATQLDQLDASGVNPLILDSFYGLMLTSHRTAQSPATLNDFSFLGHTMAFDLFQAEMKTAVMIPQIGKAIDAPHMTIRQRDGQAIMNKRLSGPTAIWNSGIVDAVTPNTPSMKAQNTFVISARVKVNEFSEYVELILTNVAQTGTV